MKAVVYERYGSPEVLRLREIAKPVPKAREVLVKVYATTATIGDSRMRSFTVPRGMWIPARLYLGIRKPRRAILGMELAGVIEAVGGEVTRFQVGDRILASTFSVGFGGYAEYKCLPEEGELTLKPDGISYGEAAAIVGGGMTALRCLHRAKIQPGQRVLIYGASGAVGTNAVQIARYFGAHVTGVCSTANLELVRSLGAETVIDYTREDLARLNDTFDVVFDAVGKLSPALGKRFAGQNGVYLNVHRDSGSGERLEDLLAVKALVEAGALRPVIDRTYTLEQIVEAHHYVDTGHKKGNVVIIVAAEG